VPGVHGPKSLRRRSDAIIRGLVVAAGAQGGCWVLLGLLQLGGRCLEAKLRHC
jgi:hypothetical protein